MAVVRGSAGYRYVPGLLALREGPLLQAAIVAMPPDADGAMSPLRLNDELVGYWVRTRRGMRPLAVHAAWRMSPDVAVSVVLALCRGYRAPEPLRLARRAAREARAHDTS